MNYLSLLIFSFFLLFHAGHLYGQGSVAGKLQDAATKQPVGYATAALLAGADSSIVGSALVNADGSFVVAPVSAGRYHLRISFVGYATKVVPNVQVTAAAPNVNLGVIPFRSASTQLRAVEVVGQREQVEYALDRRVYNVSQDLSTVGGTAVDVMQNVPSVTVDQEGTVSMRGTSNITILIDGKPSALSGLGLDQIPASTIERVEVITNPSSKFDPSGTGGVLNIILKKEKQRGLNGQISANAGLGNRYNTSLNLNYRFGKLNLFGNYDFRQDVRKGTGSQSRTSYFKTKPVGGQDTTSFQEQESRNTNERGNHNVRFGADYQLTDNQSLTGSLLYRYGYRDNTGSVQYRFLEEDRNLNSTSTRNSLGSETSNLMEYTLGYRKTFSRPGQELTADAVFNQEEETGADDFRQFYLDRQGVALGGRDSWQKNNMLEKEREFSLQADYVHPFSEKGKWEAGYRSTFERNDANVLATDLNQETGQFVNSVGRTNHFIYDEWVHAVYGNFGNKINKFSYQLGARLEQTNLVINQVTQKDRNKQDYLNLFPSLFLTYDFSEEQKIQTSYSRRIDRPGTRQLNPFLDISDSLNLRQGNPYLNPEFIDSYEVNYLKFWEHATATVGVFYRRMTDVVQSFRDPFVNEQGQNATISTFANIGSGESYGIELTGSATLTPWWRVNANASGFNYRLNAEEQGLANSSRISWTGRLNSNFTLPFKTEVQLSANYRSPTVTLQGERSEFFMASLSARKEVLGGKGNIILRVQDLFNTMRFDSYTYIAGELEERSRYKPQSQIVYVGFSYRFGNTAQKREREREENETPAGPEREGGQY
ncbi:TonB-dependent receptor domain-containing protein [Rufibacter glacialis]|uniref:TonB-dependent receptor n=1 Tax=Rufibacter glacialis TaxID=1259555 RepID=A0A5M8QR01_9BACT|nr:TonB-dependent receptor [Rufibacter glacialis]KAA6437698.1 TonB-dependent receptor [Rufibacter glacialis]GGK57120.1 TonB-dependent receptor [Rufibacter glacialis]